MRKSIITCLALIIISICATSFSNQKSPKQLTTCYAINWDIANRTMEPYGLYPIKFVAGSYYIKFYGYIPPYQLANVWENTVAYDGDFYAIITYIDNIASIYGANYEVTDFTGGCTYWE